jgi:hypothetical protein
VGISWEFRGNFKGRKRAWNDKGNLREDLREDLREYLRERWDWMAWWVLLAIRGGGRRWSGLTNKSNAEFSLGQYGQYGRQGAIRAIRGDGRVRNWRIVGELAKGAF